jgi:hypothetical protein
MLRTVSFLNCGSTAGSSVHTILCEKLCGIVSLGLVIQAFFHVSESKNLDWNTPALSLLWSSTNNQKILQPCHCCSPFIAWVLQMGPWGPSFLRNKKHRVGPQLADIVPGLKQSSRAQTLQYLCLPVAKHVTTEAQPSTCWDWQAQWPSDQALSPSLSHWL